MAFYFDLGLTWAIFLKKIQLPTAPAGRIILFCQNLMIQTKRITASIVLHVDEGSDLSQCGKKMRLYSTELSGGELAKIVSSSRACSGKTVYFQKRVYLRREGSGRFDQSNSKFAISNVALNRYSFFYGP
jgi:hypothetical protein